MVQAVAVPVSGGIPPAPAGVVVRERGAAPPVQAPTPAPQDNPYVEQPFQQPAPQPAAQPSAPAVDANLLALLANLTTRPDPAQPTPAPAPQAQPSAPVAGLDPVVDTLQNVLTSGGLDTQRAIGRALAEGDASLIDFAYIAEKGGANAENLRKAAEAAVARQEEIDTRLEQGVYQRFGGEANWDAAISFFAKNANKATTDYVVGMLKSRNPALIEQATNIVLDQVKAAGAHMVPASTVSGAGAPNGLQPLGKDDFKREIAKLNPNSPTWERDRQALFARRAQGKHLGR